MQSSFSNVLTKPLFNKTTKQT